jgi:hypothetical protein
LSPLTTYIRARVNRSIKEYRREGRGREGKGKERKGKEKRKKKYTYYLI